MNIMELGDFAVDHIFDELQYEFEDYKTTPHTVLARWKHRYEPFIYNILKQRYGVVLDTFWKGYEPPLNSDRAIVIVERRCHQNLWFILRNIAYFGRGWSIYLFCSKQNYDYCAAILGKNLKNVHLKIIYDGVVEPAVGINDYNNTLKSKAFWEQINAENLLIFQMDCYLRKHIPDEIIDYDYVGTPWSWNLKSPGGSGLSFRKRSVMIDICSKKEPGNLGEDCYVAEGVCELGYDFLHSTEASKLFLESCFMFNDPVAVHQWWTYVGTVANAMDTYRPIFRNLLTLEI